MKKPLFDEDEMYFNDSGLVVFTADYLLKRGYCCGNGCLHCPYEYKNVVDLRKKAQLLDQRKTNEKNASEINQQKIGGVDGQDL